MIRFQFGVPSERWVVSLTLLFGFLPISAEPLFLERAPNVIENGRLELGLESAYGSDEFELKGVAGTDFTATELRNGLLIRYGSADRLEIIARVPHLRWETEQKSAAGEKSSSESGLGDVAAGFKFHFSHSGSSDYGLLLSFDIPTGDEKKLLGEGFDFHPVVIAGRRFSSGNLDLNLGYRVTGSYDTGVETDPGDAFTYGISAGRVWKDWQLLAEVRGESIGEGDIGGTAIPSGSRLGITPGVRYNRGNMKTKAGVNIALGPEADRYYDWQAFLGISFVGKLSFNNP